MCSNNKFSYSTTNISNKDASYIHKTNNLNNSILNNTDLSLKKITEPIFLNNDESLNNKIKTNIVNKTNKQQQKKYKKNATDPVDINKEKSSDPKYKTELCKTFEESNYCSYGNKCRFAHGKKELFKKSEIIFNYKKKNCNSFYVEGYCSYGTRCSFKHLIKFNEINRLYYTMMLCVLKADCNMNLLNYFNSPKNKNNEIGILNNKICTDCKSYDKTLKDNIYCIHNNNILIKKNNDKRLNIFKYVTDCCYKNYDNDFKVYELSIFNFKSNILNKEKTINKPFIINSTNSLSNNLLNTLELKSSLNNLKNYNKNNNNNLINNNNNTLSYVYNNIKKSKYISKIQNLNYYNNTKENNVYLTNNQYFTNFNNITNINKNYITSVEK